MLAIPSRAAAQAAAPDSAATVAAIRAGRQVFHGVGSCLGCHGAKLQGTAIAPTLRAHKWRNGDGTLAAIVNIVSHGVKGTMMVSHPGHITDLQVQQVAAYVWAVSQGKVDP